MFAAIPSSQPVFRGPQTSVLGPHSFRVSLTEEFEDLIKKSKLAEDGPLLLKSLTDLVFNNGYYLKIGRSFSFSPDIQMKNPSLKGLLQRYELVCSEGGKPGKKNPTPTCQWLVKLNYRFLKKQWELHECHTIHNHVASKPGTQVLSQSLKGKEEEFLEVAASNQKPSEIVKGLESRYGIITTARNVTALKQRLKEKVKGGASELEKWIYARLEKGWSIEWNVDGHDKLTHLILTNPKMIANTHRWSNVLSMDGTYNTNITGYCLVAIVGINSAGKIFLSAFAFLKNEAKEDYFWLLGKYRDIMNYDGNHPLDVGLWLTDCQAAAYGPLMQLFSKAMHALCQWHCTTGIKAYIVSGPEGERMVIDSDPYHAFMNQVWKIMGSKSRGEALLQLEAFNREFPEKFTKYTCKNWLKL